MHVIKASGCTVTVSASGSPKCWRTCGRAAELAAGARSSVFRICGRRKAMTWRLKHVTASVAVDICDRSITIALIGITGTWPFSQKFAFFLGSRVTYSIVSFVLAVCQRD